MQDRGTSPDAPSQVPEALPEGIEAPPPGVRVMAVVRWALVALMAVAAAGAWLHWAGVGAATARAAAQYRCPMHPAVVQAMPGECPVCGMDLVPVAGGPATPRPAQASAAPAAAPGKGKYWCPMHPEVTSDDPEARCDACGGMKLLPREGAAAGGAVAGLAPVEIDAERAQRIGVRTAAVERRRLGVELRTVGVVAANEAAIATVFARSAGWIEELLVKESGARVARGQALATLYGPDLLAAQQAHLNAARWAQSQGTPSAPAPGGAPAATPYGTDTGKRLELLGMSPQDVADLGKTGKVQYAIPIRSPISGHVARRSASAGQYVAQGAELFQLVDLSTVWVVADVYEGEAGRVSVGQQARVKVAAHPNETFTGKVELVYPAMNSDTRTLQARIALRNGRLLLRPGMYGDVVIEGPPVEGLVVPSDAVVDTGDRRYVFVAREGGRYEPRAVRIGVQADDRVQVVEGLAEGERVVTSASFLVDSESRLRAAVESFAPAVAREEHAGHEHARADGR
jgi:Cu(I)/Ag(I) efflux system membrane fusion protein